MVFTVTLNPAIDYKMTVGDFKTGAINRSSRESLTAGGKGINVSKILNELDVENTALFFIAGRTGDMLAEAVKEDGINCDFIRLDNGMTRINVKVSAAEETEINGTGPSPAMDDVNALKNRLEAINDGDTLVFDAEGELLAKTLPYNPFLIKPNINELAAIFGKKPETLDEIQSMAEQLVERGARNVLVSMGADGATLVNKNIRLYREAPEGKVISTTGSGDSMVAGFIAGFGEKGHTEDGFKLGLAAGSASAFCAGLAGRDEIYELVKQID